MAKSNDQNQFVSTNSSVNCGGWNTNQCFSTHTLVLSCLESDDLYSDPINSVRGAFHSHHVPSLSLKCLPLFKQSSLWSWTMAPWAEYAGDVEGTVLEHVSYITLIESGKSLVLLWTLGKVKAGPWIVDHTHCSRGIRQLWVLGYNVVSVKCHTLRKATNLVRSIPGQIFTHKFCS